MNRDDAKRIHDAIDGAMESIAENHGLIFKPAKLSFTAEGVRMTVQLVLPVGGEDADNPYSRYTTAESVDTFKLMAASAGLEPEDIFQTFTDLRSNDEFMIVGFNTKRRKFPISVVRTRDKALYKFTAPEVAMYRKKAREAEAK